MMFSMHLQCHMTLLLIGFINSGCVDSEPRAVQVESASEQSLQVCWEADTDQHLLGYIVTYRPMYAHPLLEDYPQDYTQDYPVEGALR